MVSTPRELKAFLEALGAAPKKSLSQNFLIDPNILNKIVETAHIQPGENVLEVGAGPGALTQTLLEAGAQVMAVEKDSVFAQALKRFEGVRVFSGDIREFPFESLQGMYKVVANLPYQLTAVILGLLLPRHEHFSTLTLMVQEEVAQRMVAKKGSADYSLISLFVSFFSDATYAFKVSPRCFHPIPKVHSAIVHLSLKQPPLIEYEEFFALLRQGFQKRRKMVRSSLRPTYTQMQIENALESVGCSKEARPEMLSLEEWLRLYAQLKR